MQVRQLGGAKEFLTVTAGLRAQQPVLTNVIGSIAANVLDGVLPGRASYWWAAFDRTGVVVGCAIRTDPWNLVVSQMGADAGRALGAAVAAADPAVPGVTGPRAVVDAVLTGLSSPRTPVTRMTEVVHVLGAFLPATGVRGAARLAREEELDLLVQWHEQFGADVGLPLHHLRETVAARLTTGSLWWWEVEGAPVSMAGHARLVHTPAGAVGRVGPVFTPAPHRRQGFGAAATSAVVRELLPDCMTIMLYTDAANRTSNGVYARLGFRPAGEIVDVALT